MMQFEMGARQSSASIWALAACLALGACNPWFDYAPKGATANMPTNPKGSVMDQSPHSCPAKDLQYLVGQPRTVLHTMRFGSEVRFEEPGQAYTQDYVAARTRIIFGTDGKIKSVVCG
jgi:Peptidase inhibitor I78 family